MESSSDLCKRILHSVYQISIEKPPLGQRLVFSSYGKIIATVPESLSQARCIVTPDKSTVESFAYPPERNLFKR